MDSKCYNLEHEISNVEDEIRYVADYLEGHPDDFAVQLNLSNLQSRLNELKLEFLSFMMVCNMVKSLQALNQK